MFILYYLCRNVLQRTSKDSAMCDGVKTVVFGEDRECTEAIYVLLSILTKRCPKDTNYQYLKEISTKRFPFGSMRSEWLGYLRNIYNECFRPGDENAHILSTIDTEEGVSSSELSSLKEKCIRMLAESICKHLFCEVEQVSTKDKVFCVPSAGGKVRFYC